MLKTFALHLGALLLAFLGTASLDVPYAASVSGQKHDLDVFAPSNHRRDLPVIIFFHGGGLQEGDRKDYRSFGRRLAAQGYVVVVPSYRLFPATTVRGSLDDAARAVAWTRTNAAQWGGSPKRIVLLGHSAGGYLAAILALDNRYLRSVRLPANVIHGVFELSADYSNRDPDPGETASELVVDHHIYGESAEERDANSVYRYLRHVAVSFEVTCETIDPGTQCIDRDHFAASMRGFHNHVLTFDEPHSSHDELVIRVARPGDPLNLEFGRFIRAVIKN